MMQVYSDKQSLRQAIAAIKGAGQTIGLVPTMGNLHAGHLELVRTALDHCDHVVTSIFVNPLQFGPDEDLQAYPRTLEVDIAQLEAVGCHTLFAPSTDEMFGNRQLATTRVSVPRLGDDFCGKSRPGHFDGVTTIVNKLFNLVTPDIACFGLKDYQQFLIVRQMVIDLEMNIELIGVEIQREASGLALSSRNNYLTEAQRAIARELYQSLVECRDAILDGDRDYGAREQAARASLEAAGLRVDYFGICQASTLQAATPDDTDLAILAAAFLGPTRLIDNIRFELSPTP